MKNAQAKFHEYTSASCNRERRKRDIELIKYWNVTQGPKYAGTSRSNNSCRIHHMTSKLVSKLVWEINHRVQCG